MSTLLELADRVEAATGPDRELDAEIAVAALGMERDGSDLWLKGERYSIREPDYYDLEGKNCELRFYTASLDAAVSLVPEGEGRWPQLDYVSPNPNNKRNGHRVRIWTRDHFSRGGPYLGEHPSSFALALCAAALRARSASDA